MGDARHHQGTRTRGRFFLRSVLLSVVGPPHAPKCAVLGWFGTLSFTPMPAYLGGEVSMQLPPSPTLRHRRPPPTAPCLLAPHPGEGSMLHTL